MRTAIALLAIAVLAATAASDEEDILISRTYRGVRIVVMGNWPSAKVTIAEAPPGTLGPQTAVSHVTVEIGGSAKFSFRDPQEVAVKGVSITALKLDETFADGNLHFYELADGMSPKGGGKNVELRGHFLWSKEKDGALHFFDDQQRVWKRISREEMLKKQAEAEKRKK